MIQIHPNRERITKLSNVLEKEVLHSAHVSLRARAQDALTDVEKRKVQRAAAKVKSAPSSYKT
jgi:hypothetical protein